MLLIHLVRRVEHLGLATENSIEFPITQQHIADALGLSLVHTNKTLRRLTLLGLHELRDGRLRLLNPKHCTGWRITTTCRCDGYLCCRLAPTLPGCPRRQRRYSGLFKLSVSRPVTRFRPSPGSRDEPPHHSFQSFEIRPAAAATASPVNQQSSRAVARVSSATPQPSTRALGGPRERPPSEGRPCAA